MVQSSRATFNHERIIVGYLFHSFVFSIFEFAFWIYEGMKFVIFAICLELLLEIFVICLNQDILDNSTSIEPCYGINFSTYKKYLHSSNSKRLSNHP